MHKHDEFIGPKAGLEFYYDDSKAWAKIREALSVYCDNELATSVFNRLKDASKNDGHKELNDGIIVHYLRPIWTHNQFVSVFVPDLRNKAILEIKEMEKEIYSKSAALLQCDTWNTLQYYGTIIENYNPIGYVTPKKGKGDIQFYLVNADSRTNISSGDYNALKLLAQRSKDSGDAIVVILDESTPSGAYFHKMLRMHCIDYNLFKKMLADGECMGTRRLSLECSETHILVTVRCNDLTLLHRPNYQLFDNIAGGDIIFLHKQYSKQSVIEPYKAAIKEQKRTFNSCDDQLLYKLDDPTFIEKLIKMVKSRNGTFRLW